MSTVTLDRSVPLGAVWTAFTLSLRNLLRIKRLLMLLLLFLVPLVVIVTFRIVEETDSQRIVRFGIERLDRERNLSAERRAQAIQQLEEMNVKRKAKDYLQVEFICIFIIIANVAAPLTILLFASGMIRDEQEEQTLTYLLVRPIPKWALFAVKLIAAVFIAWLLTVLGVVVALLVLWTDSGQPPANDLVNRIMSILPAFGLLLMANGAVFACLSILFKRSLVIGAVYIALFEGFLANFPFILRKFTNLHYFQCIVVNQLGDYYGQYDVNKVRDPIVVWALGQDKVIPDSQEAVLTLLGVFIVAMLIGMYFFTVREFRLKTPEGN